MKTFIKILLVILVLLFIFAAVIGFLEMPVAEEGEELSMAQQWIVKLKTYLSEIMTVLGLSLDAVLLYIFLAIQKLSANTSTSANATSAEVEGIKSNQTEQQKEIIAVDNNVQALSGKLDVLMEMFGQTLLLSDLPSTVREKVQGYITDYDGLKNKVINAVSDTVKKAVGQATEAQKAECAETVGNIKNAVETADNVIKTIRNTVSRF
jgi:hypothetical protein